MVVYDFFHCGKWLFKKLFSFHQKAEKYTIIVEAKDNGQPVQLSSSCTVIVNIKDGNNHLPVITGQIVSNYFNQFGNELCYVHSSLISKFHLFLATGSRKSERITGKCSSCTSASYRWRHQRYRGLEGKISNTRRHKQKLQNHYWSRHKRGTVVCGKGIYLS